MTSDLLAEVRDAADEFLVRLRAVDPASDRVGVATVMSQLLSRLAATGIWGPENRLPSSELWKRAGDVMSAGSLQLHARTKPFGYAGDFEMLARICANDRRGDALGWAFDDFFQRQPAPCAVRNRAQIIADQIVACVRAQPQRQVKVVNVGAGPAHDVWLASERLDNDEWARWQLHLVDLDPRALAFCQQRFSQLQAGCASFQTYRKNLKRLDRGADVPEVFGDADLIVCPGFLDYLDRDEAAALLRFFYTQLREGGQLLAFNFADPNPSRAYMEWIGNWYLIYRTLEDLREIRHHAGIPDVEESVGAEAENVNLLLQVRKS